ncbi:dihydrofolate reductase family protein [Kribbella sp. CA-253562]|uniref:dihydrofolate reductase family protein n=1 Tax=Kribbella sp. CA-253562 TaxID=3239942 RepID=UPI003D923570
MSTTIMYAAVSADGYVGRTDGGIGPLFDWFHGGPMAWNWLGSQMRTNEASKGFIETVYSPGIGAMVVGRYVFDQTNGWGGQAVAGDHVFVVTHEPPTDWEFAGKAPYTFVTDGVESAVAQAREVAGDRIVDVAAGNVGGQALRLGLIDQVVMNVVPVVFGEGRPFFGRADGEVTLASPALVAQGEGVTHLLYDVPAV